MKRKDGIAVYLCDARGMRLEGRVPGSKELIILLVQANLSGRYGCFFADEATEDMLVPYSDGYTSIRVSDPGSGALLIASRKGESRKFQRLKLVLPAGVEESVAHRRLFDAAHDPMWVCKDSPLPLVSEERMAVTSEPEPVLRLVDMDAEGPVAGVGTGVSISSDAALDPFSGMTDKEFLSAAAAFSADTLGREHGMKEWLSAIVAMRRSMELRLSTSEEEVRAGHDGAEARLRAKQFALERIRLLFPEAEDYFKRLLPAAKAIRARLEDLPTPLE